jgi:LPS sulfotransferase NodH
VIAVTDAAAGQQSLRLRTDLYMIACAARTGSTMLVRLLRSHPHMISHGEVWGDAMVGVDGHLAVSCERQPGFRQALERQRFEHPQRVLYKHFFDARGARACGFKLKYDELVQPRWHEVRRLVETDTDIGIVFLHRDDLLQRYLSHQVVLRQTGVTNVPSGGDLPRIEPFAVDIEDCLADIVETRRRRREFAAAFAAHRRLHLHYEDLAADPQRECDRVFAFLGLPSAPVRVATEKLVRDPPQRLVLNHAALIAALRDAGLDAADRDFAAAH